MSCFRYSKVLLKYFLSEGAFQGHGVFFASCNGNGEAFLKSLPEVRAASSTSEEGEGKRTEDTETKKKEDKMQIAWRYQNQQVWA